MQTVVDFHSHILPEMDDGSSCLDESISMLRMEAEQGIRRVVATPHFYANYDSPERFFRRRNRSVEHLQEALRRQENLPKVSVGAEVYFFPGISESDVLQELTIAGTRYVMIEMPHSPWSESMFRECFTAARQADIALEFNPFMFSAAKSNEKEDLLDNCFVQMLATAKQCGCKFTYGSDDHSAVGYKRNARSEAAADAIGLTMDSEPELTETEQRQEISFYKDAVAADTELKVITSRQAFPWDTER